MVRLARLAGRRSAREDEGAFVVEGPNLVAEALSAGAPLECIFVTPGPRPLEIEQLLTGAARTGTAVYEVEPAALRRAADVVSPQPIVAVAHIPTPAPWPAAAAPQEPGAPRPSLVLVLAGVADPGNAGTLLRAAEAAGAGAVVFTAGSVDPYNPKCVRASAGAVFHVGVVVEPDAAAVLGRLRHSGHRRVGTVVRGGAAYDQVDLRGPVTVILGNEAHGLPADLAAEVDLPVSIPMAGRAESLNVAMTGAVLCFEVLRQRRTADAGR